MYTYTNRRLLRDKVYKRLFNKNAASNPQPETQKLLHEHRKELLGSSSMTTERGFFNAAWRLMKPYWVDAGIKQNGASWALLALTIGLTFFNVRDVAVGFNDWNNDIGNLLQNSYNAVAGGLEVKAQAYGAMGDLMDQLIWLTSKALFVGAVSYKAGQESVLRWRKWMTEDFQKRMLENQAFLRMQHVESPIDNPDQRIQQDPAEFADFAMEMVTEAVDSVITLATFSSRLWDQSGTLLGIPRFMFCLVMGYCAMGTALMYYTAHPLEKRKQQQQQVEGNYRSDLKDTDEKAESIALNGAEKVQKGILSRAFNAVFGNYRSIINVKTALLVTRVIYNRVAGVVPIVATFPAIVNGEMKMGGVLKTIGTFSEVRGALNFYVVNVQKFKEGKANMNRLIEMDDMLTRMKEEYEQRKNASWVPPEDDDILPDAPTISAPKTAPPQPAPGL